MKAIVQRVRQASVSVSGEVRGAIEHGLLIYLGVGQHDDERDVAWLAGKIAGLRIFEDTDEKMNLSVGDIGGGVLTISQFTLFADVRKGKRPSWGLAAAPGKAEVLYEQFKAAIASLVSPAACGVFGASMAVAYVNDGPVTLILDTDEVLPKPGHDC
ncbi:MAG: D-tyrosyl-tRNA(Tyr) deacylase [Spirochaetes bacterium GWD1_61_31]|nr:MAG: D-tyrosyl-tRNA(Tyr) deacylase [Spirochaetes bacterium GWB1_60_80]OHD32837.1 MAG: D-tyrosyl-tRNA(Tyr) deacylase [Spirochaetes bacterium GWC1_61_12]OHD35080.1 MAG: D-tyrosyl-tRNA(Tyr) deacylase [Spirochaetes bacterium GWD1_61_31]OHD42754.1 MAG: D-tyrosyl-tRNA(Tyr) deacylase [Spirochaetes bacterium GWE1_60_18]OHD58606.1 MAG: D-tyrosyl-tRNA(Tyr) deacylase [Spirochaetes bacterium GWF1_60_12]HAP44441.1 D-tyrosyl-tRNA(Tyr) deacylase [Spirochaetaceae bacterium]